MIATAILVTFAIVSARSAVRHWRAHALTRTHARLGHLPRRALPPPRHVGGIVLMSSCVIRLDGAWRCTRCSGWTEHSDQRASYHAVSHTHGVW